MTRLVADDATATLIAAPAPSQYVNMIRAEAAFTRP
jgi:hypothetical protein